MEEIWKDIEGFEGRYQVSNMGRVKSFKRYPKGKILKEGINTKGYPQVGLCINGISKSTNISRIVAIAFIPNPGNLPFVLHIDDNPMNSRADNLRWGTCNDNIQDMVNKNRHTKGSLQHAAKLNEKQVLEIKSRLTGKRGENVILGKEFGVIPETISAIKLNKTWKHV